MLVCAITLPVMEVEFPASRAGIDDLPDEVIVRILSHSTLRELASVTQNVCVRWRRLSHDPELWRNKKYCIERYCHEYDTPELLQQMPQLRSLEVQCLTGGSVLQALFDTCSRLTSLEFHKFQQLPLHYLQIFAENCTNIESLAIPHQALGDKHKSQTLARLSKLQSLVLKIDRDLRFKRIHLRPLADGCCELARLEVDDVANIHIRDLKYLFNAKCESLTHLKLPWAMYVRYGRRSIVPLLKICTSLVHLELYGCDDVDDDELPEAFAGLDRLSNLRTLIINYLEECAARSLALVFESGGLSQLQVLDLSHRCSEANIMEADVVEVDVVEAVCRHCPQLRELHLRHCLELTDDALGHLYLLSKLDTLDLSECIHLTGEALQHIARVTTLRKLVLDKLNARRLEAGLKRLLDVASLESLSIRFMADVNIFPFVRLPEKLVHLRVLDVRGAELDDCDVLDQLREQMPRLQVYTVLDESQTVNGY